MCVVDKTCRLQFANVLCHSTVVTIILIEYNWSQAEDIFATVKYLEIFLPGVCFYAQLLFYLNSFGKRIQKLMESEDQEDQEKNQKDLL